MRAANDRPRYRGPVLLVVLALLAGALVAFPAAAGATSYVVTECGDGGGANTLRGRIAAANADASTPHLITFDFAAACPTILLAGTQLTLSRSMTIEGPGADELAVSGNATSRVFSISGGLTVTLSGLTISGGSNITDAGIFNTGTLTVADSKLSGNQATYDGGGIANVSGTLTVTHSTLSGNTAFYDGGGIYIKGNQLVLTASIVAGNSASSGAPDIFGTITSGGYNLLGDASGSTGVTHGVNGDIAGGDADLGALADNGGSTWTQALGADSVAIDHIPEGEAGCGTDIVEDQRGVGRPQVAGCDIGAFEVEAERDWAQGCLYGGALSQVSVLASGEASTATCGRGMPVVLEQGDGYYGCLYAGSADTGGHECAVELRAWRAGRAGGG